MTVILALFSLPFQYLLYERPQFFVFALLALTSAGTLVTSQHFNQNYYGVSYDTPSLRAGKAMASLGVALTIALVFQVFVARTPARRTLRKALGHLVYSNLAYNTILQAYVRSGL